MKFIIGLLVVYGSVISGYVLAHGKLLAIWQPLELLIILGSAMGAFIISNPGWVIKRCLSLMGSLISGSKFNNKKTFMELLKLQFEIATKIRKAGLMTIEADIEAPANSELFKPYPAIVKDHHIMDFLSDNLRVIIAGNLPVHDFETLLDKELEAHHELLEKPSEAITKLADGLPGFGIVAAVLGIVITMGMLGGDPKLLGAHVGAALVGTFLGILFAYGMFGPIALSISADAAMEAKYYECIKIFLLAVASGNAPQLVVEYARRVLPNHVKPSFLELEEYVKPK